MTEYLQESTVVFVDLAGFTALTEAHGDHQAADLAERFTDLARGALAPSDRFIKSIGDAVMFTSTRPEFALEALKRLMTECHSTTAFPISRAGLHHGPVVERGGDVFGASVNLAARVAGQASGDQVLGTSVVAQAAHETGFLVSSVGSARLRNIASPIELFEIELDDTHASSHIVDPVCRMRIEPALAVGSLRHDGLEWWFCSMECAKAFASAPDNFARMSD